MAFASLALPEISWILGLLLLVILITSIAACTCFKKKEKTPEYGTAGRLSITRDSPVVQYQPRNGSLRKERSEDVNSKRNSWTVRDRALPEIPRPLSVQETTRTKARAPKPPAKVFPMRPEDGAAGPSTAVTPPTTPAPPLPTGEASLAVCGAVPSSDIPYMTPPLHQPTTPPDRSITEAEELVRSEVPYTVISVREPLARIVQQQPPPPALQENQSSDPYAQVAGEEQMYAEIGPRALPPLPASDTEGRRRVEDLYAKVRKKRDTLSSSRQDVGGPEGGQASFDDSSDSEVYERLKGYEKIQPPGYERVKRGQLKGGSSEDQSDPGYERVASKEDDPGYERVMKTNNASKSSEDDPGYERVSNKEEDRSESGYEWVQGNNEEFDVSEPGYEEVNKEPGYEQVNKPYEPAYARVSKADDISEPGYELVNKPYEPAYARVSKADDISEPGYEQVNKPDDISEPGYEQVNKVDDIYEPGYEEVKNSNQPYPAYARVLKADNLSELGSDDISEPGYEQVNSNKPYEPAYARVLKSDEPGYEPVQDDYEPVVNGDDLSDPGYERVSQTNNLSDDEPGYERVLNDNEPGYECVSNKPPPEPCYGPDNERVEPSYAQVQRRPSRSFSSRYATVLYVPGNSSEATFL